MHVQQTGKTWSVMDGEQVVQEFPTNAAAWSYMSRIERRALWCSNRSAIKHNAFTHDPEAP